MTLASPLYRRLLSYLRRYLFPHVIVLLAAMLTLSATTGAIPLLIKRFVDQLAGSRNVGALPWLSFELLALFLIRALADFGSDYLEAYVSQKITLDLRSDLNQCLQNQSLAFFNRTSTGIMMSRVINDVGLVSTNAIVSLFSIFGDGTALIALLGSAIIMDWKLAALGLIGFPAAVLPISTFSKRMRGMTRSAQKQLGGLNVLMQETYQGNRVVKAFGMEDYERSRFSRELRHLFRINMRVARIKAATGPIIEVMGACAIVGVIWWGSMSVITGKRTPGIFGGFVAVMLLVYRPFKGLARTNNSIQQGLGAAERVFEMMDAPIEVTDDPAGLDLPSGNHVVRLDHVSFRYGDEWVLRDINLEIGAGEVIALVGMSGGGKSTIADLIPRFYDIQQGAVTVDGIDVRRLKLAALRAQIGIVTQQTFLFNDTIRANIAYGSLEKSLDAVIAAARAANAHDFISRLPDGYDTIVGELGVRLSGGERQRLAIARALLKNAPILILDEATSSLDSDAERQVQEALERLMENRTTLVIAHRLSTVRRADRIVVVVHGRIVEAGTHDELIARGGEYSRLHELQFTAPAEVATNGGLTG
jgi:subfamily B ATP-binding cassette protein MsbA